MPHADPEFRRTLRVTYQFEKLQPMRLVIYDVDAHEKDNRKLKLAEQASRVTKAGRQAAGSCA